MIIVRRGDPDYDKDRVILNARFDYRPWAIYYCANAKDVARAIADAPPTAGRDRAGARSRRRTAGGG